MFQVFSVQKILKFYLISKLFSYLLLCLFFFLLSWRQTNKKIFIKIHGKEHNASSLKEEVSMFTIADYSQNFLLLMFSFIMFFKFGFSLVRSIKSKGFRELLVVRGDEFDFYVRELIISNIFDYIQQLKIALSCSSMHS